VTYNEGSELYIDQELSHFELVHAYIQENIKEIKEYWIKSKWKFVKSWLPST
jgi:hypothetical protein